MLIGRVAGLECLARVAIMALYGPQTQRNATEVADLIAMVTPSLKRDAAGLIAAAGLTGGAAELAQSTAEAVIAAALNEALRHRDLAEKVKLHDAPPPEKPN